VTGFLKARITDTDKWAWARLILFSVFSAVMLLNSMNTKSPLIGIPASLAFLYTSSVATSKIFFPNEKSFLKQTLGVAAFILIMALLGTCLILVARFTEIISLVGAIAVGLILSLLSLFRKPSDVPGVSQQSETRKSEKEKSYLLLFPFLFSVVVAFYALLLARTGEGKVSVWLTIPNFFLPIFFLSSLLLVIMLFFARMNVGLKLALTSLHSFLSHSLFLIVWYPGRYGDVWSHLGEARFIDNAGTFYAYDWLFSNRLISDIVKYKSQYALVVFFRRMFSLDIYWVHVFFIPLLWSIFVPILSYKLAELLAVKKSKTFPLLAAISTGLFPTLVYWGAVSSVPNSLSFIFFLFSIMLLLYWVDSGVKRILFLSLLASAASFFAHPLAGIFAFILFFAGVIFQIESHRILKILFFFFLLVAYPYFSYLQGATFSLEGFLNLENFLSFQSDITAFLLIFGILGFVFGIRGKLAKVRGALMLFLFYVILAGNYYISMYGMKNGPIPERIPLLMVFPLVPFVALGLLVMVNFLRIGLSRAKAYPLKKAATSSSVALLVVCLFVSLMAMSALYQAHPRQEITEVQPAAYEIEAVYFIDSDAAGRYIVICNPGLATVAIGFLGVEYSYGSVSRGMFGVPEWDWWSMQVYSRMLRNPSVSILEEAMARAGTGICYFVISVNDAAYEDVVQRTSAVFPVYKVFGGGKLSVFKYISSILPIRGPGPHLKVILDDGSFTQAGTWYSYLFKSHVTYSIELSGHSSYNITDYPINWTFLSLSVNHVERPFDEKSDVNAFIYISGLDPGDVLDVAWGANDHYPYGGWKDDSFRNGWQTHVYYTGNANAPVSPDIVEDGNTISLSWNFTTYYGKYQYYYYMKNVTVSTDDYQYILVKWKSTGPVAVLAVAYADDPPFQYEIVPYGSDSPDWTVSVMRLDPNKETTYVVIGITNLRTGPNYDMMGLQTLYVDFVLICGQE